MKSDNLFLNVIDETGVRITINAAHIVLMEPMCDSTKVHLSTPIDGEDRFVVIKGSLGTIVAILWDNAVVVDLVSPFLHRKKKKTGKKLKLKKPGKKESNG